MVFRLYKMPGEAQIAPATGPLAGVRNAVRGARNVIRDVQEKLSPFGRYNPLQGRVLVREYRFVMMIEHLEENPEVRAHVQYTAQRFHVDLPLRNARGFTRFRMSGHTHWTPIWVNGIPVDGDAALKDLAELIDDYLHPVEGYPSDLMLTWFNFLAPISAEDPFGEFEWIVIPPRNGLRRVQSNRRPLVRSFSLEFTGLQSNRDLAKMEDGFLAGLLSRGMLRRLLDLFDLGFIGEYVDAIFGTLDDVIGLLTDLQNLATQVNDFIRGAQDFIRASIAKVRALLNGVNQLIATIERGIDLLLDFPSLTSEQLRLLRQSYPGLQSEDDAEVAIIAAGQARRVREFLLGLIAQPAAFRAPTTRDSSAATIAIRAIPGATIERLAQQANTSVQALIELNGLRYPFVEPGPRPERQKSFAELALAKAHAALSLVQQENAVLMAAGEPPKDEGPALAAIEAAQAAVAEQSDAEGAEGVIYAGDLVRIPVAGQPVAPSVVGADGNQVLESRIPVTEEERLMGIDLALSADGDLEWDERMQDLRLVGGIENIHRTQIRYVKLPQGALRFAPGIGFARELLGGWQSDAANKMLSYSLWTTLQQDPRIREIRSLRAGHYAGQSDLTYDAVLINGETAPDLRLPVAS